MWSEIVLSFEIDFGYFKVKNVNMIWITHLTTPSNGRVFPDRFLFSFPKLGVFDTSHKEFFSKKKINQDMYDVCVNLLTYAYIITLCFLTAVILKESCLDLYCIKTYWFKIT